MEPRGATTEPPDTDRPPQAAELPTEKAFVLQLTRATGATLESFAGRLGTSRAAVASDSRASPTFETPSPVCWTKPALGGQKAWPVEEIAERPQALGRREISWSPRHSRWRTGSQAKSVEG